MAALDRESLREYLLIDGLMDAISLGFIHSMSMYDNHEPARSVHESQSLTLSLIRELVEDGYFILGVPTRKGGFDPWDLPLGEAMGKIEDIYVKNFEDRWSWTTIVWINQTEKGKKLALEIYHADEDDSDQQTS